MMSASFSKLFYDLHESEVGDVVLFSCFDRARELMRTYKTDVLNEFKGFLKGFTLSIHGRRLTVIITGPGSARVGDAVLALKGSACRFLFYTAAAGGIGRNINVGDLIVPKRAIIGDGFSHYHKALDKNDLFGNYAYATRCLVDKFQAYVASRKDWNALLYFGDIFTTESLFSETQSFLLKLEQRFIRAIDMETSAFFTAAENLNVPCMALHYISDLPQRHDLPNIFNKGCRKTYVKLPYLLIDFIKNELRL